MLNGPATWIELNKTFLDQNIAQFKNIIGSSILAPVIKANAYGHGIKQVAQILNQNSHVDWLCVSNLSEAFSLRQQQITKSILVLSTIDAELHEVKKNNIHLTVSDIKTAQELEEFGKKYKCYFDVHLKVDTGLSRLGFSVIDFPTSLLKISSFDHLNITGMYTHCAESQNSDQTFTQRQVTAFEHMVKQINSNSLLIHCANTAATTCVTTRFCNFFRVGAGIYGIWPSDYIRQRTQQQFATFDVTPILTWKTRIIEIKKIPSHTTIGYDRTYTSSKETTIAILPIGYFHGYDFRLSNRGIVHIRNTSAPVIGRVSMNLTSIDISHIPSAQVGDEVILLGNYPKSTIYDYKTYSQNANIRELVTTINPNIPRLIV